MEGFIQLHRKMVEWEWYSEPKTFAVFLHCLLKANWKDKNWKGNIIKRGTFITSLDSLSKETGLSVRQIRTSLSKLEMTSELTKEGHSTYTLIKVNNYDKYQSNDKRDDKPKTNGGQTDDKPKTTTNKVNNNNKDIIEQFETFWKAYPKKQGKVKAIEYFKKHIKSGVKLETLLGAIEKYKKDKDPNFYHQGSTWLYQEIFRDYEQVKEKKREVIEEENDLAWKLT